MSALLVAARPRALVSGRVLLLGPAFVAASAYVDPGNVVTNTVAGARTGYLLVWVVVTANVAAGLVQYLSAKLGVVTGRSLPEVLAARLSPGGRAAFCVQAELVAMATDLAEVVGGALALDMLFGVPLVVGALVTVAASMAVLAAHRLAAGRGLQRAVTTMLAVVATGFCAGLVVRRPNVAAVLGGLQPRLGGGGSVLLAAGILGATVMPHAMYAHSALARDRHGRTPDPARRSVLLRATRLDVSLALAVAGAVNLALLLLGAAALPGEARAATLPGVHSALVQQLGPVVGVLFAVGLLFSGVASTSVGCYAGGVVTEGMVGVRVPVAVRRLLTAVPAVLVLGTGMSPTAVLIDSQVVLSFGIPFALVPLVWLTSHRPTMADGVNRAATTGTAVAVCTAAVALNAYLVVLFARGQA